MDLWLGLALMHQSPRRFGFDSQTRGTRENRRAQCESTGFRTGLAPSRVRVHRSQTCVWGRSMCRGRRTRILLHLHIQREKIVLRGSRAGRRCDDDDDLLSPDLNRDLSRTRKEGLRGHPRPGVDFNVSAWSRPSVFAVHTAVSPGFCTPTRGFQD
jgi:hypothetical protein